MQNNIINNWQIENGEEKDVVLSSRIRLARNLKEYKFPNRSDIKEKTKVINYLRDKIFYLKDQNYDFYLMDNLNEIERNVLHEEYLISRNHVQYPNARALFLNNEKNISIMINEEDHLRIQILKPGLEFNNIWNEINNLDEQLEENLDYAFSKKWGYLTSCPTNIGTALRASVMCHLPALVLSGKIDNILGAVGKFGLTVRGVSGEGSNSEAELFQISNQITLGFSEKEIIEKLESVIKQIIAEERKSREYLLENNFLKLKDNVLRSFGVLKYAYHLDQSEALKYLSRIKFGQDTNLIEEKLDKNLFSKLLFKIKNAHLQYDSKEKLDIEELNIKRAKIIRNELNKE
ncbi:Putative ATP:guanido phosphotransferase YacI [Halanaerobium saccharolyticum subsp. saccharolyticum DSM 6643]|uniref:Protein-arginine kinase n=1 Tax=Halanaerobium saccharolyticum subsp. saccharolyticum DSM 6643 TaxID=1293054 RepID=M5E235_9FIRM|nr:protein arginine kinase [Halanaerobium saccharolyticum]CCU79614.1 Putative ATP:guanido phosphotransferase YacI [Halanaerobium saccharolyticum subsp. saccharolyticum DSM 6643]